MKTISAGSCKSRVHSTASMPRSFTSLKVSSTSCRYWTTTVVMPGSSKQAGAVNSNNFPPPVGSTTVSAGSEPFMILSSASPCSEDLYATGAISTNLKAFRRLGPDSVLLGTSLFLGFLGLWEWPGSGIPCRHDIRKPDGLDVVFFETLLLVLELLFVTRGPGHTRASPIDSVA